MSRLSHGAERTRWFHRRKLRIWSLSIPFVGTIVRPGRDGFADLPTLRRRDNIRVWWLPAGHALIRSVGRRRTRWTLALSWGPSGGIYLHPRRVCLGPVAVTFVPRVEIDDLMEAYVAEGDSERLLALLAIARDGLKKAWRYIDEDRELKAMKIIGETHRASAPALAQEADRG